MATKPTIAVIIDEGLTRTSLATDLRQRYDAHYDVVKLSSAEALSALSPVGLGGGGYHCGGAVGREVRGRFLDGAPQGSARRASDPAGGSRPVGQPPRAPSHGAGRGRRLRVCALGAERAVGSIYRWRNTSRPGAKPIATGMYAVTIVGRRRDERSHELRDLLTRATVPFRFLDAETTGRAGRPAGYGVAQFESSGGPVVQWGDCGGPGRREDGRAPGISTFQTGDDLRRRDRGRRPRWALGRGVCHVRRADDRSHRPQRPGWASRHELAYPQLLGLPARAQRRRVHQSRGRASMSFSGPSSCSASGQWSSNSPMTST